MMRQPVLARRVIGLSSVFLIMRFTLLTRLTIAIVRRSKTARRWIEEYRDAPDTPTAKRLAVQVFLDHVDGIGELFSSYGYREKHK
jgi:hypothetical protein